MAKKRRNTKTTSAYDRQLRVNPLIANLLKVAVPYPAPLRTALTEIEDNRRFHPDTPYKPIRSLNRAVTPTVVSNRARQPAPVYTAFKEPQRVLVCIRRKQRREVLHAMQKAGGGGSRRRNWKQSSMIRC